MLLKVGNKKVLVKSVILFGTTARANNLDGYVLNSNGQPIGYNKDYSDRKNREVVNLNDIILTANNQLPTLTRKDKAISNAIIDYAIVYKGATVKSSDRIEVIA